METRSFGTTTERFVRAAVFVVLVDVFAIMFLWDGFIGYQSNNAAQLVALLGLSETQAPVVNPRVTRDKGTELAESQGRGLNATTIEEAFGKASLENGDAAYYVGPGGWLSVTHRGGEISQIEWTDGKHTASDQEWQRYIGYALALLSLYASYGFMKIVGTRITITDEGIRVFGRPPVGWDAISGITLGNSGVVSLDVEGGESIQIDEYDYKGVDLIVGTICERKGFANPLDAA